MTKAEKMKSTKTKPKMKTTSRALATLLLDRASELQISSEAASSRSRSEGDAGAARELTRAQESANPAQSSEDEGTPDHHLVHHPDVHRVCSVPKCNGRPLLSGRCPEHA